MSVLHFIVPSDAAPKRAVIGYSLICLFFIALTISGLIRRKVGFKPFVLAKYHCYERDKNPISYWLVVAFYAAAAAGVIYLILRQISS